MEDVREVLRRLARFEGEGLPVLSVYLDMRPEATGERPGQRPGETVLKDRLREIERTFGPRGPELDSFRADAERVGRYVAEERSAAAEGVALFACAGRGLFEVVEAGAPFESQVSVGPAPDLFQLARLLDEAETAVIAVVDSNTARLFVRRAGVLEETQGVDVDDKYLRRRAPARGWAQAKFQRHNLRVRAEFAREVAAELERQVSESGASRVILAGDEPAIAQLEGALPAGLAGKVREVVRLPIRAGQAAVEAEVAPLLAQAEAEDSLAVADRLVGAVRSGGLGAAGLEPTRQAALAGQADEVVLDPAAVDEAARAELVRLATQTGATVEVVEGHAGLRQLGGVGALLRYRR